MLRKGTCRAVLKSVSIKSTSRCLKPVAGASKGVLGTYRGCYDNVPGISLSLRSSRCESREDLCAKTFQLDEVLVGKTQLQPSLLAIKNKTQ